MFSRFKLVIFDLDGTLLNTIDDLGIACNHALLSFGYPTHTLEEYKHLVGNGIDRLIFRALPETERTEQIVKQLRTVFVNYYDNHCCDLTKPYAGMVMLVKSLIAQGVKVAVASNKYQAAAQKIVEHYFPCNQLIIKGQQEGVPVKPNPMVIDNIVSECRVAKSDVVLIGDSDVDIQTARNANIKSIGVAWGFRGRAELENAGADEVVDNVEQLNQLLFD